MSNQRIIHFTLVPLTALILVAALVFLTAGPSTLVQAADTPNWQQMRGTMPMTGTMSMTNAMPAMMNQMMQQMQTMMGQNMGMMGAMTSTMPVTSAMPMRQSGLGDSMRMMGQMMQMMGMMQEMMPAYRAAMTGAMPMSGTMPMKNIGMGSMMQMMGMMMQMMGMMQSMETDVMSHTMPMTTTMPMHAEMCQMMGMLDQMMQMTGSRTQPFDLLFIDSMIMHHQGAVAMAKEAQQKAEHPELKQMADAIITAQEAEIKQMQAWRKAWYPNAPQTSGLGMSMGTMKIAADASKPFDLRFIEAMIPHHEGAITMAKAAQAKAQHQEIKTLSSNIIASQQKEIAQMQAWKAAWSKS